MATRDKDLSELIPDYCNDRMNAGERAEFELLMEQDSVLSEEVLDFQEFKELYRQTDSVEPPPSDALFDKICMQAGVKEQKERQATVQKPDSLSETVLRFWDTVREYFSVPWALAAVQMAVIVLLLVPAPRQQDTYQTLSATQSVEMAGTVRVNVVFRPDATASDIQQLLQSLQGSVTSGPSMEGRYVISFAKGDELQQILQILKQDESVLFAEPAS